MSPVFDLDGLALTRGTSVYGFRLATERGWYAGAPARAGVESRQGGHGGVDAQTWRGPRVVTLSGTGYFADHTGALLAARDLTGLDPRPGRLSVTDELGTLSALVRVASEPTIAWVTPTLFRWDVALVAPDYRKQGPPVPATAPLPKDTLTGLPFDPSAFTEPFPFGEAPTQGILVAENPGTAPADPLITLTAGASGLEGPVEIIEWATGSVLRFDGNVAPGHRVDIDAATRTVLLDGTVNRRELLSSAQWWQVPRGGQSTVSWTHSGGESDDALLTVTVAPNYL